jgi:hypothetical protein
MMVTVKMDTLPEVDGTVSKGTTHFRSPSPALALVVLPVQWSYISLRFFKSLELFISDSHH